MSLTVEQATELINEHLQVVYSVYEPESILYKKFEEERQRLVGLKKALHYSINFKGF